MKPYRRNYVIGIGLFIIGLLIFWIAETGLLDIFGKVMAAAGFILAGWSGRQWWYYEKQAKPSE